MGWFGAPQRGANQARRDHGLPTPTLTTRAGARAKYHDAHEGRCARSEHGSFTRAVIAQETTRLGRRLKVSRRDTNRASVAPRGACGNTLSRAQGVRLTLSRTRGYAWFTSSRVGAHGVPCRARRHGVSSSRVGARFLVAGVGVGALRAVKDK
jgi:hypothetical protein